MDFDSVLSPVERLSVRLRRIYQEAGFSLYRMGRFEEYGLYQENRRFLADGPVLTFTDLDGRLMALKPDVTLSIAKNAPVKAGETGRYYYSENVYRPSRESRRFREIRQMGLECIGDVDAAATARIVELALRTLQAAGGEAEEAAENMRAPGAFWTLEAGHMGFVSGLFDACGVPEAARGRFLSHIRARSFHALAELSAREGISKIEPLLQLEFLSGDWKTVLSDAEKLVQNAAMSAALEELRGIGETLNSISGTDRGLCLDLSLVNDMEYYNGLILQGFLAGVPGPVLRGGRYDPLAARFRPNAHAVGFALYLDELERFFTDTARNAADTARNAAENMISIALPKGRLGDQVYSLLSRAGYAAGEMDGDSRKLVIENQAAGVRYFLVKPSDVSVYVEHGAADVGVVGKDILEEHAPDVYELLDTGLGKCRMCVAAPAGFQDDPNRTLRVATKFVNIAKRHFADRGREIDIIKLHGSIELAPLLELSDVIVDIVETGTTLKANGLQVLEEFLPVSARLIANPSSFRFKRGAIENLRNAFREVTES